MFELFVASDAARRQMERAFEPATRKPAKPEPVRPKTVRVRSFSAAALRNLADRLEPSLG
jgi:hypothetical protein